MRIYLADIEKSNTPYSIPITNNDRNLQYLPLGNNGQVLTVVAGQVAWANSGGGSSCICISQKQVDRWEEAFSWGDHNLVGYEVQTNKVTNFSLVNNTTYPTTSAVWNLLQSVPNQDLSLGIRTATTLPINISLGTGVVLPPASTSFAGLMTAEDKTKLQNLQGDKNFIFEQSTPSTNWTVAHGLNKYPSVTIMDTAGSIIDAEVEWIGLNTISISFNAPVAGIATLN